MAKNEGSKGLRLSFEEVAMTASQSVMDVAVCEEYGYMLPMGAEYALSNDRGDVVAMVCWREPTDQSGKIEEVIFAISEQALALVPRLSGDVHVGDWLQAQIKAGLAHKYYRDVAFHHPDVVRIDDCRPGGGWCYRIYDGEHMSTKPSLIPGVVYYCYVGNSDYPRGEQLRTFEEVKDLMRLPEAVPIVDVRDLWGKSWDDPEVVAQFGDMSKAVRVLNEYLIQRNIENSSDTE